MKFLLIRNAPLETPGLVGEFLRSRGVECRDVLAADRLPDADEFDALAVFGSPESCVQLSTESPFARVRETIGEFVRSERPVLGVCFGAQLLAQALGARVRKCEQPEIGAEKIELTDAGKESGFFDRFPSPFVAAQWHSDTFDLPEGAALLATNGECRNQAFASGRALGVQFHPELTLERAREWVQEYADELSGYSKSPEQVRSELESTHDERARLCKMLVDNFLRANCGKP